LTPANCSALFVVARLSFSSRMIGTIWTTKQPSAKPPENWPLSSASRRKLSRQELHPSAPITEPIHKRSCCASSKALPRALRVEAGNQQAGQAALASVNPGTIRWPNVSHCSRLPGA